MPSHHSSDDYEPKLRPAKIAPIEQEEVKPVAKEARQVEEEYWEQYFRLSILAVKMTL